MKTPDWDRLHAIADEAERLRAADAFTRAGYERLLDAARKAAHGHGEFVEFLVNMAEPAWLGVASEK